PVPFLEVVRERVEFGGHARVAAEVEAVVEGPVAAGAAEGRVLQGPYVVGQEAAFEDRDAQGALAGGEARRQAREGAAGAAAVRLGASLRHLLPISSGWIRSSRLRRRRTPWRANRSSANSCRGEGSRGCRAAARSGAEGVSEPVTRPLSRPWGGPRSFGVR